MKETDVALYDVVDGEEVLVRPITRLGNIEDGAEVKAAPEDGDYIPVVDAKAGGQMKKTPVGALPYLPLSGGTLAADRLPVVPVTKGGTGRTTAPAAANALGRGCGVCSTASNVASKVLSLPGFALIPGAVVGIKFTAQNRAARPALNVGGTGAKPIYDCRTGTYPAVGAMVIGMHYFMYDGSAWVLLNPEIFSSGTTDLTAGTSTLGTGQLHFVYE